MEVSLVRTSLVNEPGNCGDIIPIVYELTKRTHEKNVRRLGTIIQSIFCAQSGASIHLTVWKWSGESRYPGALPPVLENFRRAFSPGPTDCPWVSEDGHTDEPQRGRNSCLWLQSRSVLSSFGVVLMSCRVNFYVVRSALQYSACRI